VAGVVGRPGATPAVLAADPVSGLALLRIPPGEGAAGFELRTTDTLRTPAYAVLVEGTRGGPVVRPVFFGRTDAVDDPRWPGLLLVAGGTLGAQPGSLVFTLGGGFAGLAVVAERSFGVVPARTVLAAATGLTRSAPAAGDLGLEVQDLTSALAAATGAGQGAVVTYVDPGGPSARDVRVGDVVEALGGEPVLGADDLRVRVARSAPGQASVLRLRRRGETVEARLVSRAPRGSAVAGAPLGIVLRDVVGVGAEVMRVAPGSVAASVRLLPGDVITHLDGDTAPRARRIAERFEALAPGGALILGVRRGLDRRVLALDKR
jgi:S1-C subfamily serine protease